MTPERARGLMHEWVASPALRAHMEAVAACTRAYGVRLDPPQADRWFVAGLLHDFDYERHPTGAEHPVVGVKHLATLTGDDEVDAEIREAILGHAAERTGVARTAPMAKALFACDELAGFIVACCKVRPDGIASLEPRSVKKKLKDKAFAAAVSRADIAMGVAELAGLCGSADAGAFEAEHIAACIEAIKGARDRIGV
ncbi:MAG: HD domain-containing protein [Phycisphaerales bacterium]